MLSNMKIRINYKNCLFIYLLTILLLAVLPLNSMNFFLNTNYVLGLRLDCILHIVIYMPISYLLYKSRYLPLKILLVTLFILPVLMEGVQLVFPYRTFNVNDLVADFVGSSFSLLILFFIGSKNYMSLKVKTIILVFFDLILMFFIVLGPSLLTQGHPKLNLSLLIFVFIWPIVSYAFGKYKTDMLSIKNELLAIFFSGFAFWSFISLYIIVFQHYQKSYEGLMWAIFLVLLIEFIFRIFYYVFYRKKYAHHKTSFISSLGIRKKNWIALFFNLFFVFVAFMIVIWLKPATLRTYLPAYTPFLLIYLAWELIVNLVSQKNNFKSKNSIAEFIKPVIYTNIFTFLLLALLVYIARLFSLSRLVLFGTVGIASFFQVLFVIIYYLHLKMNKNIDKSERLLSITPFDEILSRADNIQLEELPDLEDPAQSVVDYLSGKALRKYPELFDFIASRLNLKGIYEEESLALNTKTLYNLQAQDDNSLSLFINLQRINDISTINKYFAQMNTCMKEGGYVVGCGNVIRHIHEKYNNNYNNVIASFLYAVNFIFKRVLPKLPVYQEINYFLTKGKNRTLSQTEILGRLVYNGFKIVDTKDVNGKFYFIAAKVNTPFEKENPSYGPFISLKRIGKNGKIIKIYKFRTMHPYAEYIQDYVYETGGGTIDGDGFKNDFRITGWGKIFRKLWIDELPMFINLIKGDVKLVGVRPLSQHKFSILDKDLQVKRVKYLPGLVPPFYADLPKNLEEIQNSERKYLENYAKHKVLTDFKYFFKAFKNIVFRGARSK